MHVVHVFFVKQDLDVDPKEMNRETPEETGVYFLSSSLPQHCLYTRVGALQKLKVRKKERKNKRKAGVAPIQMKECSICSTGN